MMFWWSQHGDGWAFLLMAINMLLFWGLVILGTVALVRGLARSARPTDDRDVHRPTAGEVVAERFARGEIDEQEYRSRKAALRGDPQQGGGGERR
jgi:putative membrane protein